MTNCTTVNPSIGVSTGSIKQAEPGRRWTFCWTKLLRFQLFREKGVGTRRRLNSCLRLYINGSSGSCTSKHKHTRGVSEQFPRFLSQGYLPFYLSLFLPFPLFLCLFNLYTAYSASLEKVDETALIKKSNEVRATEVLGVLGPDGRDVTHTHTHTHTLRNLPTTTTGGCSRLYSYSGEVQRNSEGDGRNDVRNRLLARS